MQVGRDNFRYLNREGKWLDFHWRGLEVSPAGALRLLSSPRLLGPSSSGSTTGTPPDAPGGVAVDESGRVFYSLPEQNRIVVSGGCNPEETSLSCLTEPIGIGQLKTPRGLLLLARTGRLVVVDSGHGRLLFYDLVDFELREVWGGLGIDSLPGPTDPLQEPWTLAADTLEHNLFLLDSGSNRIIKFKRTSEVDEKFSAHIQSSGLLSRPGGLAVSGSGDDTRVFVSDLDSNKIFIFNQSGNPLLDKQGAPLVLSVPGMGQVIALAVSDTTLYAGDNSQQRLLSFSLAPDFVFSGEAAGFHGYVTALAVDRNNQTLVVMTGAETAPLVFSEHAAFLSFGFLWSDAIRVASGPVDWHRLRALVTSSAGAHIEFHYAISNSATTPPVDPNADNPFTDTQWRSLPVDVEDFSLKDERKPFLFIAARFFSDRTSTPLLSQLLVEFDVDSYMRYLPAIYREPALARVERPGEPPDTQPESDFLKRFVSLFQGLFEDVENEVDSLERYFDPYTAPPEALAWLASWLAVELDLGEPELRIRESIARAFRRYQWRGTVRGLRLALLEDAGVHASISEPISAGTVWAMSPETTCGVTPAVSGALLGAGTRLTSMEPGGAVLGSTAQLDHSYLITDAQFGEPLFAGVANQFVVEVHQAEVSTAARLQLVKTIIEREKPAHTMYRLVVNDPSMRAGLQARLGVDSVVSGPSGPSALGESAGPGIRLGGSSALRLGSSRLGDDLKL